MNKQINSFSPVFNKYRLKSQFETLSEFGEALAREGFVYEDSIFSRWKNGDRFPTKRTLLLAIIKVFIKHKGINQPQEANELLLTAAQPSLTIQEQTEVFKYYYIANAKILEIFTENDAIYLAENLLGKPYFLLNINKIKTIYQQTKYSPVKFINILKQINDNPQTVDSVIQQLYFKDMVLNDNSNLSNKPYSKKTLELSYFLTKNPPHFYGGFIIH